MAGAAIVGTGSYVPDTVRLNDDPVFDWLHEHHPAGKDLFTGYKERRILAEGQTVVDLMVPAAERALARASRSVEEVDLVLGYATVSRWEMPNDLVRVAVRLGVSSHVPVVALNNEYVNYNQALVLADAMIASGRARCVLVVVGCNWAEHVDFHTPQSISAGDGAGAAVVAASDDDSRFRLLGTATECDYGFLGGMFMGADEVQPPRQPPEYGAPVVHITELGLRAFADFGIPRPPLVLARLLEVHGVTADQIAFVGHQASEVLNTAWRAAVQPGQFVESLASLANMTLANIAVNFDRCYDEITMPFVALVGLGPEVSCNVVLLGRALPPGTAP